MLTAAQITARLINLAIRVAVCSWNGHERTATVGGYCRYCEKRLPDARHAFLK